MSSAPILRVRGYLIEATRKDGTSFLCGHRNESHGPNRGHRLGGYSEPVLFRSSTLAKNTIKKNNFHWNRIFKQPIDMSYRVIPVVLEIKLGIAAGPGRMPDEPAVRSAYKVVQPRRKTGRRKRLYHE